LELLGVKISDIQVTWNNTVLLGTYKDSLIVLISGSKKYGVIDIANDFPLNHPDNSIIPNEEKDKYSNLSNFYVKNLGEELRNSEGMVNCVSDFTSMNESFFVTTNDNILYGWGWNEHGNLGTENLEDFSSPIKIEENIGKIYGNGAYTILKYLNP